MRDQPSRKAPFSFVLRRLSALAETARPQPPTFVPDTDLSPEPVAMEAAGAFRLDGADGFGDLGRRSFAGHDPLLSLRLEEGAWRCRWAAAVHTIPFEPRDPFGPVRAVSRALRAYGGTGGAFFVELAYELGERLNALRPRPRARVEAIFELHDRIAERVAGGWRVRTLGLSGRGTGGDLASWARALPGPTPRAAKEPRVRLVSASPDAETYRDGVRRILGHITAGDVYQANLTRMLELEIDDTPLAYHRALTASHPAPFAAYRVGSNGISAGISPELFLDVSERRVATRPIKGTRPRGDTPARDRALREELLSSEKDAAELVMIIDLMRNDLGRVARPGSVRVPSLRRLDEHPSLYHLSGVVEAELDSGRDVFDLLAAAFPAGSITGAPKRRAMEILADLETRPRGTYTGSMGLVHLNGDAVLNVAIRTARLWPAPGTGHPPRTRARLGVGSGIVADSDPETERLETLHKARAFFLGHEPHDQAPAPRACVS